jgi:protein-S-isoprenylcysteine O-methyltransferase Ste14
VDRFWVLPLLAGFGFNAASAFTTAFTRRWGERAGRLVTVVLRNVLGIPIWTVGIVLAVRSPSPALWTPATMLVVAGWLLLGLGSLLQVLAVAVLRRSAAAPSIRDALVEHGPYARLRHPIYAGLLLQFAAIVLVRPRAPVIWACSIGAGWAFLQARLEELDLLQRLPGYAAYMTRVPRFMPRRSAGPGGTRPPD